MNITIAHNKVICSKGDVRGEFTIQHGKLSMATANKDTFLPFQCVRSDLRKSFDEVMKWAATQPLFVSTTDMQAFVKTLRRATSASIVLPRAGRGNTTRSGGIFFEVSVLKKASEIPWSLKRFGEIAAKFVAGFEVKRARSENSERACGAMAGLFFPVSDENMPMAVWERWLKSAEESVANVSSTLPQGIVESKEYLPVEVQDLWAAVRPVKDANAAIDSQLARVICTAPLKWYRGFMAEDALNYQDLVEVSISHLRAETGWPEETIKRSWQRLARDIGLTDYVFTRHKLVIGAKKTEIVGKLKLLWFFE